MEQGEYVKTKTETFPDRGTGSIELSVVIPCLNEADTLAICIQKAQRAFYENEINGEIIVADNGSTDASPQIARDLNVKVVNVREKGYGSALMGGIAASRGKFIIMGDADESYDFLEIPKFIAKLREGYDLVQGCRLPRGGGVIKEGAMPFSHRWVGNPMFTWLAGLLFNAPINDVYCGLRGFTRKHFDFLEQRCTGMEFATEMIIKSSMYCAKIAEVPITLHRDGRIAHPPHLRTFRDGWRTLRFFLLYSPKWLFYFPGRFLIFLGLLCYALALPKVSLFGLVTFDVQTMLFGSLFITCGYQAILFFILTKTFAISEKLHPTSERFVRFNHRINLERGLMFSLVAVCAGLFLLGVVMYDWKSVNFGDLNLTYTLRLVIPGVMLASLGFESILFSFFIGVLRLPRK
jgi:glycosyltransferase involved in cell wall biosynthesis